MSCWPQKIEITTGLCVRRSLFSGPVPSRRSFTSSSPIWWSFIRETVFLINRFLNSPHLLFNIKQRFFWIKEGSRPIIFRPGPILMSNIFFIYIWSPSSSWTNRHEPLRKSILCDRYYSWTSWSRDDCKPGLLRNNTPRRTRDNLRIL